MSPFSHLLHELRVKRNVRQMDLAERLGYEQSYISALEVGLKGPPTPEFVERLIAVLPLEAAEANELRAAVDASQRKLVIDVDTPEDVYWLLNDLRSKLPSLAPCHVRLIKEVLSLTEARPESWSDQSRRVGRRRKQEAAM